MTAQSSAVPTIGRIYPGGDGDVNRFHAAGGMAFTIAELLRAGLLHGDILTVVGDSLADYALGPSLEGDALTWISPPVAPIDRGILRTVAEPFAADGGMRLMVGNLGRGIFKTSAVQPAYWTVEAPAAVFANQDDVLAAFKAGELDRDVVVVVRFQGPRANGMPELHKLTPVLGVLQDRGFHVALVTDGRMSGASGKIPAAIHVIPEAAVGGPLACVRDGDMIMVCAVTGVLRMEVDPATREPTPPPSDRRHRA